MTWDPVTRNALSLALGIMLTTASSLNGQDPSTPMRAVPQPITNVEATLATISATIHPSQPMAAQNIQVEAVVENQGGPASKDGLGFLVVCVKLQDGPKCPVEYPFTVSMPSIAYGQKHKVMVSLGNQWAPGKYRLVVGTDVVFDHDARDLELVVKPLPYSGIRMRERDVAWERDPDPSNTPDSRADESMARANPNAGAELPPNPRGRRDAMPGINVFSAPQWNGKRVDLCLVWGGQCGEPAATEFCKRSGYEKATVWQPANDIGAQTPTVVLGPDAICDEAFCDGFASITCIK